MSFLGANPTTSGGTFGTATPSTGFSFGSGDAKSVFGSPSTDTKSAFNFTSPTPNNPPAFGGFAFGAKTTAATSSLFTSPTTTNATSAFGTKPLNFGGFTSPPNQTVGSPGFGQPVAQQSPQQPQQQNLSFGATTQQAAVPAFGTPAPNTQGSTGMFGNTSSLLKPGGTGFGFQTPASGFSSVPPPASAATAVPQTTQAALSFGSATTTTSNQFAFGGAKTGGFSFGQATPAAPAATSAAPTSAFAFATNNQQPAASQPQTSLNFSTPTANLNFGGAQTTAPPAFGSTTQNLANQNQPLPQPVATQSSLNFNTSQAPNFSTSQPQTGLNLGLSSSSSLSFPKPVTSTPAANTLNFTSQPSTTQPLSFGAPQTTANLSFGSTAASTQNSATLSFPTVSTVQSSLPQTSMGFGTSTAQSTTGLNFGTSTSASFGKPAMSSTTTASVLPTSAASKPATGFGFPTSSALPLSTASTTAPGITTLGQAATSAAMPPLSTATTTTAPAVPAAITSLTFAQLEENINKWTIELEEQEKTFINQATQINAWDRLLISNGEKIVELNDSVQTVKNEQQSLDHELDFIVAQQKELQELLAPLEKQLLENTNDRMRDPEREHMYNLAENLDTQLRQMSEDLKEVIEHLNETNRSQDSNDPIVQIGRILNAHMSSMQWIDTSIAQITTKLDQLKATHDTLRRDNERSFQLTYN